MRRIFTKNTFLCLITDRNASGISHSETVKQAISAGIGIIQFREKNLSRKEFFQLAALIRDITFNKRVKLIINDFVDVALAVGADGVHLGQNDLPIYEARKILGKQKIIGITTRTVRQAVDAESSGADYIGFGPIFTTSTKRTVRPKGLKALRVIREHVKIPVIAIGGIKPGNAREVLEAGANAMAVASGILSGDIKMNIRRYRTYPANI